MELVFRAALLDEMIAHLETFLQVLAVENSLHSPVRFQMNPAGQLWAFEQIEAAGWLLLAIFHSHPRGPKFPSTTDIAEFYYPGTLVLIASPAEALPFDQAQPAGLVWKNWQINGYQIEHKSFLAVKLGLFA